MALDVRELFVTLVVRELFVALDVKKLFVWCCRSRVAWCGH